MFDLTLLRALTDAHFNVVRVVVAGTKGSTPREAGTEMYVWHGGQDGTIGGGQLEFQAIQRARAVLDGYDGGVTRHTLGPDMGQCCGGAVTLVTEAFKPTQLPVFGPAFARRVEGDAPMPGVILRAVQKTQSLKVPVPHLFSDGWLLEPILGPATPVVIYGAGHVGQALAQILDPLPDFGVTLADDRQNMPTQYERETLGVFAAIESSHALTHHLILTHSHDLDLAILHELLGRQTGSIGLIGSRTKWAKFQKRLKGLGHTEAQLSGVICPIGDPTLGKHPAAIALGVATDLMRMVNSTSGKRGAA